MDKEIEYTFEKLIFAVKASSLYDKYKEVKDEYNNILLIINRWLYNYINNKGLNIDRKLFNDVKDKLFNLDSKHLSVNGLYAEEAYEWIIQLEIIIDKITKINIL